MTGDRMDRGDVDELLAAYALDAVDAAEAAAIEAALEHNSELRHELDQYHSTLAVIIEHTEPSPSTPSPTVWEAIEAELAGTEMPPSPKFARVTEVRSSRRWSRWGAGVAVAAVAASLVLGLWVVDLRDQLDADATLDDLVAAALNDPNATIVDLAGQEGSESSSARIILDEDGFGYVLSHTLAPLDTAHTYQLWVIVGDGGEQRTISAGVLGSNPGVSRFEADADILGLAITEEIAGGVAASEQPPLALWLRDA